MSNPSVFTVSDMVHNKSFPINGTSISLRAALAAFYAIEESDVASRISGANVQLTNFGQIGEADLDRQAQVGENLIVYPASVANGGVKGARS